MTAAPASLDPADLVVDDPAALLALLDQPPKAGRLATAARRDATGDQVWIYDLTSASASASSGGDVADWPSVRDLAARALEPGQLPLCVSNTQAEAFATWLCDVARTMRAHGARPADPDFALAPYSPDPAGTHRLWLVAAARLALPAPVRVMALHDRVGLRIAQLALAFGADALGGPIAPDRKLPLAGVARPNENTRAGLQALVEQAGLTPRFRETREIP